tara:strand:+ start:89 stop:526 length:438 start_codon:yes stop_codon:yes gene_type:complete
MKCVYKISCIDENIKEFYIGSSVNLYNRIIQHEYLFNKGCKYKVYEFIRENGGLINWEINPIEIFNLIDEDELRQYEQFYIDEYNPILNDRNAIGRNKEKYKISHRPQWVKHNKIKQNCPHCNKEMLKRNIKRHINKKWCKNNIV